MKNQRHRGATADARPVGLSWPRSGLAVAADAHDPGSVGSDLAWQRRLMLMMHGSVGRFCLAGAADAHDARSVGLSWPRSSLAGDADAHDARVCGP